MGCNGPPPEKYKHAIYHPKYGMVCFGDDPLGIKPRSFIHTDSIELYNKLFFVRFAAHGIWHDSHIRIYNCVEVGNCSNNVAFATMDERLYHVVHARPCSSRWYDFQRPSRFVGCAIQFDAVFYNKHCVVKFSDGRSLAFKFNEITKGNYIIV